VFDLTIHFYNLDNHLAFIFNVIYIKPVFDVKQNDIIFIIVIIMYY
jgi:hypothetical protein